MKNEFEPVCGGTETRIDENAPKQIISREITWLYISFFLESEWSERVNNRRCTFKITADEQGSLIAREEKSGVAYAADKQLLNELAQIEQEYELAANNGVYKVTAGLPPQFQECCYESRHSSGEVLKFTLNNKPEWDWTRKIYISFAEFFDRCGDSSFLPFNYRGEIVDLRLRRKENGMVTLYKARIRDGKGHIEKVVFHSKTNAVSEDREKYFDKSAFGEMKRITNDSVLRFYDRYSVLHGLGVKLGGDETQDELIITVKFDSGDRVDIETQQSNEINGLRPLFDELSSCLDTLV